MYNQDSHRENGRQTLLSQHWAQVLGKVFEQCHYIRKNFFLMVFVGCLLNMERRREYVKDNAFNRQQRNFVKYLLQDIDLLGSSGWHCASGLLICTASHEQYELEREHTQKFKFLANRFVGTSYDCNSMHSCIQAETYLVGA